MVLDQNHPETQINANNVTNSEMSKKRFVVKRNGQQEPFQFEKIQTRLETLVTRKTELKNVDISFIAQKVVSGLKSGITTYEIDKMAAQEAIFKVCDHPEYGELSSRIVVSNLHKNTSESFTDTMEAVHRQCDWRDHYAMTKPFDDDEGFLSNEYMKVIRQHKHLLDNAIDHEYDYMHDYFGMTTMLNGYLNGVEDQVLERPQYIWMRVAVALNLDNMENAIHYYNIIKKYCMHASPTLFNAGKKNAQMSSCFLLNMKGDSIFDIFTTLRDCAMISKYAGGIGINISNVRARGSLIKSSGGKSNGIVPMLKVYEATADYVDQGGGKRKGAFAIYIEPHHVDIEEFLELRNNNNSEKQRTLDLFLALWISDLFMERVESDDQWSLFTSSSAPGLEDVYGDEYKELYTRYEREGRATKTMSARELFLKIIDAQIRSGTPYMLYKDSANLKSNQKNLGTIKGSNLCTEIIEYTSPNETAVCNLGAMRLPEFITYDTLDDDKKYFDFEKFRTVVREVIRNLNKVIDLNFYPVPESRKSNMRHRPIGLGVQGLCDVFMIMGFPFESKGAEILNEKIFRHMYYAAVQESCQLAREQGPYETFWGSPASEGKLQFDLWGVVPPEDPDLDWESLKTMVKQFGLRNSLLIAPMPTASTSQICGNSPCFEPNFTNMYVRKTKSGYFIRQNKHLVRHLIERDLLKPGLLKKIVSENGSIQNIDLPEDLKQLYKDVWDMKPSAVLRLAADRGPYIDQSQSMNVFVKEPSHEIMSSLHFYGWKRGLKTGMYYLRAPPPTEAVQFTVDNDDIVDNDDNDDASVPVCMLGDECVSCS